VAQKVFFEHIVVLRVKNGEKGQRGYAKTFCFKFSVEFKRKSLIAKNRFGKNYTEEVVLVERRSPLFKGVSSSFHNKDRAEIEDSFKFPQKKENESILNDFG